MKAPAEVPTLDRMSTREELKQVLDLLTDADAADNDRKAGPVEDWQLLDPPDLWHANLEGEDYTASVPAEEHAQASELASISDLFLHTTERTN